MKMEIGNDSHKSILYDLGAGLSPAPDPLIKLLCEPLERGKRYAGCWAASLRALRTIIKIASSSASARSRASGFPD